MLNLRNNAFYLLGVSPEATEAEVADAYDDAVMGGLVDEGKLQAAKSALTIPKKRLAEELSSLWGIPPGEWDKWLTKENPEEWGGMRHGAARINRAAHFLSEIDSGNCLDELRQAALTQVIEKRDVFPKLLHAINDTRKKAGVKPPLGEHFQDALRALSEKHRQAAMCAIETTHRPHIIMTDIAEEWRYDKTESGAFTADLVRAYDRWSIPKLRSIEKSINETVDALQNGEVGETEIDEIEFLLAKWNKYSAPMQLMNEAKGLDEPRSKVLWIKLNSWAVDLSDDHREYGAALRIFHILKRAFRKLPGRAKILASNVATLQRLYSRQD